MEYEGLKKKKTLIKHEHYDVVRQPWNASFNWPELQYRKINDAIS